MLQDASNPKRPYRAPGVFSLAWDAEQIVTHQSEVTAGIKEVYSGSKTMSEKMVLKPHTHIPATHIPWNSEHGIPRTKPERCLPVHTKRLTEDVRQGAA